MAGPFVSFLRRRKEAGFPLLAVLGGGAIAGGIAAALSPSKEEAAEPPPPPPPPKPSTPVWYKRPAVLAGIGGAVVVLGIAFYLTRG